MTDKDQDRVLIWVCKDFKSILKKTAVNNDKSILDYTRELTRMPDPFEPLMRKKKRRNLWD